MNMFVMADRNWGMSNKGRPLASIPQEKKTKIEALSGKVVVYDLKTMQDLPGQQPLHGSVNLIYTDGRATEVRGGETFTDIPGLRKAISRYPGDQVYIIGSEKLYREFLGETDTIHVTKIDYAYEADSFFPDIDKDPDFYIAEDSDEQYCFDMVYSFLRYERRKKK